MYKIKELTYKEVYNILNDEYNNLINDSDE